MKSAQKKQNKGILFPKCKVILSLQNLKEMAELDAECPQKNISCNLKGHDLVVRRKVSLSCSFQPLNWSELDRRNRND